jgi:serine/threonine protein kinase
VAVKLLREGPLADFASRSRLQREVSVLAALDHPNIVSVIDSGVTPEGLDYLVMNFITGQPLHEFIQENRQAETGNADPTSLLILFTKICDAMNAAHLRGIVHRDLSPSNIMIDGQGAPHILDFGLARTAFDRHIGGGGRTISIAGTFMGKMAYASPEQARGESEKIDIRTDVYALGVILYQILTGGEFPYDVSGNVVEVLSKIVNEQPTPPSRQIALRQTQQPSQTQRRFRKPPVVNRVMEAIVLKALEKEPKNRYQSAGELGNDVENYLAGRPTAAHRESNRFGAPVLSPAKSSSWPIAAAILIVGLTIGGWAMIHFFSSESPPPAKVATSNTAQVRPTAPSAGPATPGPAMPGPAMPGTAAASPAQPMAVPGPSPQVLSPATSTASLSPQVSSGPQVIQGPLRPGPGYAVNSPPLAGPQPSVSNRADNAVPAPRMLGPGNVPILPQQGQSIDLLASVHLPKDGKSGKWTKTNEGIESDDAKQAELELNYTPSGEYDFQITFTANSETGRVEQYLVFDGKYFAWIMGAHSGFARVNDRAYNSNSSTRKTDFAVGHTYTVQVKVRSDSVTAYLDGAELSRLETDYSNLSPGPSNHIRDGHLGVGTFESPTIFHTIKVIPINGANK